MLQVKELTAAYHGIVALRGVDFDVGDTEMVALIGPNGAGKSTLLNCLSNVVARTGGSVVFGGRDTARLPPHQVTRSGLLHVPEGRQILADLSVEENLQLGRLALAGRQPTHSLDDVCTLFPILRARKTQRAGSLSGGEQQMLAIGRALMGAPRLLLLDEPSLGLSPIMANNVFAALRDLNKSGLPILLVEQNARRALDVTDRAFVLEQGRIVHAGESKAMLRDPRVIEHYLGHAEV